VPLPSVNCFLCVTVEISCVTLRIYSCLIIVIVCVLTAIVDDLKLHEVTVTVHITYLNISDIIHHDMVADI